MGTVRPAGGGSMSTWKIVGHIRREEDEHGPAQDIPVIEVEEYESSHGGGWEATLSGDDIHDYGKRHGYTFHPVTPPLRPLQVGDVVTWRAGNVVAENGLVLETAPETRDVVRVRWPEGEAVCPRRSALRLVLTADGQPYTGEDA
jgi:hypothetical protein